MYRQTQTFNTRQQCSVFRRIRTIIWQLYYNSLRTCSALFCAIRELRLTVCFVCVSIRGSKLNIECQMAFAPLCLDFQYGKKKISEIYKYFFNIRNLACSRDTNCLFITNRISIKNNHIIVFRNDDMFRSKMSVVRPTLQKP